MAALPQKNSAWRSRIWLATALLLPSMALGDDPSPARLASRNPAHVVAPHAEKSSGTHSQAAPYAAEAAAIERAKAAIASCKRDFAKVTDYTCMFFKRERIDGKLQGRYAMTMKARAKPLSIYFKLIQPDAGREAIYVAGRNSGKAIVHDVGFGKLIAGTLKLDPEGGMAMEGCRHPITEAGIGHMIDVIDRAWTNELDPRESRVLFHEGVLVGDRPCVMIESIHPEKKPNFMFYKVKVYIDTEHNLPIRFEAYDWPSPGREAELIEEFIYANLKLNVNLQDKDFDPKNSSYSFGRF